MGIRQSRQGGSKAVQSVLRYIAIWDAFVPKFPRLIRCVAPKLRFSYPKEIRSKIQSLFVVGLATGAKDIWVNPFWRKQEEGIHNLSHHPKPRVVSHYLHTTSVHCWLPSRCFASSLPVLISIGKYVWCYVVFTKPVAPHPLWTKISYNAEHLTSDFLAVMSSLSRQQHSYFLNSKSIYNNAICDGVSQDQ